MTALGILLEYLTDTAISPLQKEFVEKHPPLANHVSYSIIENTEGLFYVNFRWDNKSLSTLNMEIGVKTQFLFFMHLLFFSNVPTERLEEIPPKLHALLKTIAEGDGEEAFDLQRMRNEVKRKITKTLNLFEDDPHEHIAGMRIG